ncbi:aminoacyl-tRNA hydrolase [candidate division KSB1 bacterium]|nr:aminoacyl-tRNA hydrolase [candidate division KSB1 bacterium]
MPLIAGLGNPGAEYDGTPHNVGFEVVDLLAARAGLRWKRSRAGDANEVVLPTAPRVVLLKPLTYMNRSGGAVSAVLRYYQLTAAELLVVCDDVNLPESHLRFREQGGAGGQKGLLSIIHTLGTDRIARLRIGVGGGAPGADVAAHVLSRFRGESRKRMDETVERAAAAVECFLHDGLAAAMNRFNTSKSDNSPPSGAPESPDQ